MTDTTPQPTGWPVCAECNTVCILRRIPISGSTESAWVWMRDCRCPDTGFITLTGQTAQAVVVGRGDPRYHSKRWWQR